MAENESGEDEVRLGAAAAASKAMTDARVGEASKPDAARGAGRGGGAGAPAATAAAEIMAETRATDGPKTTTAPARAAPGSTGE